ncbi:glutathione S-transferase [Burkholderiales bacterium]|nr:glutathione S-transferase [Burkholderiales bacterium]
MKLYHAPGACSLAPHIALFEAGIAAETIRVDLRSHTLPDGSDYLAVNPKGYVPMLELDDGTTYTEVAVLLQIIADRKPGTLAPAAGAPERYRQQEWLNFIATEIHKGYGMLWHPEVGEAAVAAAKASLAKRYAIVEAQLGRTKFIAGDGFTVADAYLFTVTRWSDFLKVDLSAFPNLQAYQKRIAARPGVIAAMTAERLIKAAA